MLPLARENVLELENSADKTIESFWVPQFRCRLKFFLPSFELIIKLSGVSAPVMKTGCGPIRERE